MSSSRVLLPTTPIKQTSLRVTRRVRLDYYVLYKGKDYARNDTRYKLTTLAKPFYQRTKI